MKKNIWLSFLFLALYAQGFAQVTVGLLQSNAAEDGYELFAPIRSDTTYLIDKCGRLVHQWGSSNTPGMSVYLLPDGSLLRSGNVHNNVFNGNGEQGGMIEKYDWDNNLTWSYIISSDTQTQNHDIYPLANGNVLAVIWEAIDSTTAIAAGRNPSMLLSVLFSAKIQELQPVGTHSANIVWQWRLWDHLIQDYDSTKSNYGVVADHPELVNLNFSDSGSATKDWIHANAITYDDTLDQIILSAHNLSEIWMIDHSTSTAQAASHTGGAHGKGGDLLYRWGNPQAYNRGNAGNRVLYTQHSPSWIPAGYPNANNIIIFNNGIGRPGGNYSSVDIFSPPVDSNGDYLLSPGQAYGPAGVIWSYTASPTPASFFGNVMGGAQPLANGNVIACEGPDGNFFEIDSAKNVLWRYKNPVSVNSPVNQGTAITNNGVFRCTQYDASYSAFTGKTLSPLRHIEGNAVLIACDSAINAVNDFSLADDVIIYPNPATDKIIVGLSAGYSSSTYQIVNMPGQIVIEGKAQNNKFEIGLDGINPGLYIVQIKSGDKEIQKKLLINQ